MRDTSKRKEVLMQFQIYFEPQDINVRLFKTGVFLRTKTRNTHIQHPDGPAQTLGFEASIHPLGELFIMRDASKRKEVMALMAISDLFRTTRH
ncbi:hypothetical protein AVEN_205558-1 [Araneus ventricosus]|uniref:Uncharacterized protein n=1 Tax=Araneus ventricosus TaxID=182803 RepID=A0A4Y2WAD9_ARAVE|nr:hypothetical protein AVEN_205558-1 [Araneus ventricosus]